MSNSYRIFVTVFLAFLLTSSASAAGINSVEVIDKKDRDGDGYVSDFSLNVDTSSVINEKGENYEGKLFESRGEKEMTVYGITSALYGSSSNARIGPLTWRTYRRIAGEPISFNYQDAKSTQVDKDFPDREKLKGLVIDYDEKDTTGNDGLDDVADEDVEEHRVLFKESNKLKIEKPSLDRKKAFSIFSKPSDAKVNLEARFEGDYEWEEKKAETPITVNIPVDADETVGGIFVTVSKKGYEESSSRISPEDGSVTYELNKIERELILTSDPSNATVKINGNEMGETPFRKKYWTEKELEIEVTGNNRTVNFTATTPYSREVDLTSDSGSYNFGTNYDYQLNTFDPGFGLPDLTGLVYPEIEPLPPKAMVGKKLEFNASESFSFGYNITSHSWDFGDGTTKTGEVVTHSYSQPGNYTVNLTVEDSNGTKAHITESIVVENSKPVPGFKTTETTHRVGEPVSFNAGPSQDRDGKIAKYSWKFGDGSQTNGAKATHVYGSPGNYTVELTVTDGFGASARGSRTIRVRESNVKPRPAFSVSDSNPSTGQSITLDATGSSDRDGNIRSYAWNMGDGLTKTGSRISYNYTRNGSYTVELVVVDDSGASATTKKKIEVSGKPVQRSGVADGNGSGARQQDQGESKGSNGTGEQNGDSSPAENQTAESSLRAERIADLLSKLLVLIF